MTIKVHPTETKGRVMLELDIEGIELLERFLKRVHPLPQDSGENLNKIKDRVAGVLIACRAQGGV